MTTAKGGGLRLIELLTVANPAAYIRFSEIEPAAHGPGSRVVGIDI